MTNDHVVEGADEITVRLAAGRTFDAVIKGQDKKLDLALLKISTGEDLPLADVLAASFNLKETKGALVAETNLQLFDVILEVNGKSTGNVEAFRAAAGEVKKGDLLRLLVKRGDASLYTALKID